MQIIHGLANLPGYCNNNIYLALGNFDGVHLAHQAVISAAISRARDRGAASAALILDPHPAKVLNPTQNFSLLTDLELKAELFNALGLDYLVVEPFSHDTALLTPDDFVKDYLLGILKVRGVVTGFDYTFGKNASGKPSDLQKWGKNNGFEAISCPPVTLEGQVVSSSLIRELVKEGNMEKSSDFLNYYLYRHGKVVPGAGKGREMGFPTANIDIPSGLLLPGEGVYFTAVKIKEELFFGAANVGSCPTFASRDFTVEVNVLGYNENLYEQKITVYFLKKIREERAFPSVEELKKQVLSDIEFSRGLAMGQYKGFSPGFKRNNP